MLWNELIEIEQLDLIKNKSYERTQVIFKHSTRCSISSIAKQRLEKKQAPKSIDFYYLDLIAHRDISGKIEDYFQVHHESPQIIVIKNAKCVYDESHSAINMEEIADFA